MTLRTLQDWVVRPRLLQVPGVADVVSYGGLVKEIHVEPDPTQDGRARRRARRPLRRAEEGQRQRHRRLRRARRGDVRHPQPRHLHQTCRTSSRCASAHHGGVPVLVKDVATVPSGYAPRQGIVTPRRRRGRGRGHRADAPRREPVGRARQRCAKRSRAVNGGVLPPGRHADAVLRPHRARRHDAQAPCSTTWPRARCSSSLRALHLPAVAARLAHRGASSSRSRSRRRSSTSTCAACRPTCSRWARSTSASSSTARSSSSSTCSTSCRDGEGPSAETLHRSASSRRPARSRGRRCSRCSSSSPPTCRSSRCSASRAASSRRWPTPWSARWSARCSSASRWCRCSARRRCAGPRSRSATRRCSRWARRAYDPMLDVSHGATPARCSIVAVVRARRRRSMLLPRLGSEFLPELNEGVALRHLHAARQHLAHRRAASSTPRDHASCCGARPKSSSVLSQLGRPEDGTDPTLPNNLEVFVKLQAARRVAAGHPHARRPRRRDGRRTSRRSPASSTTSRSRSATTSPRTSPASSARSRSRSTATISTSCSDAAEQADGASSPRCPAPPTSGIVKSGETPQLGGRPRSRRARALRPRSRRRAGLHRDGDGRPRRQRALGGREALRRHRAPAARRRARTSGRSAT